MDKTASRMSVEEGGRPCWEMVSGRITILSHLR
jgi:hypothetical protein